MVTEMTGLEEEFVRRAGGRLRLHGPGNPTLSAENLGLRSAGGGYERKRRPLSALVEILRCSALTPPAQRATLLQVADGPGIGRVPVHMDDTRAAVVGGSQCPPQRDVRRR